MVTLKQLQKQNERLRKAQSKLNDIRQVQMEREKLIRENKQLAFRAKHPKLVETTDRFVKATAKFGISAFRGLQKYGRRLAKAERMEQARNRKLKSVVKKTPKKKVMKRKRK